MWDTIVRESCKTSWQYETFQKALAPDWTPTFPPCLPHSAVIGKYRSKVAFFLINKICELWTERLDRSDGFHTSKADKHLADSFGCGLG